MSCQRLLRKIFFLNFNPLNTNRKIMAKFLPRELIHARKLMDQAKFGEALEIIEEFETDESLA